jgi:predicted AlkP superfamily pyrophosphatase or phosphodiesterase
MPRSRRHFVLNALLFALSSSLSCMRATANAEGAPLSPVPIATPKLVVLIAVDQLRGDMLDKYRSQLRYGYARLMRGAWFTRGYQDHALTETAPGHASVMSGRFPRSTGITSNVSGGVIDPNYRLLVGNEGGASPFRFQGTTLFDWLYARNNRTRALSVSTKDRGAILPIGRAKQDVYWYSGTGNFTTSTYYRDTLPSWVTAFNARRIPHRYAGTQWRLLLDSTAYSEPDSVPLENGGRNVTMPKTFPPDSAAAASLIRGTPSMDSVLALFALEGVRQTGIGQGPHTDVLSVSFSATDYVGHAYGPDSREAHDNELRLDHTIGWFIDSLYRIRDSSSVVIALTGDHGVQPIPELARQRGEATGDEGLRVSPRAILGLFSEARQRLAAAGVDSMAFMTDGEIFGLRRDEIRRAKLNADSILNAFAAVVRQVRGVARVDRLSAMRRADFALDPIARRWSHQFPENSPWDLAVTLTRYSYWGNSPGATHGSPYDLDAHVPIIFYGPWAKPGRYTEFARTVDIAPTLAAMMGVTPTEKLDGRVLVNAVLR